MHGPVLNINDVELHSLPPEHAPDGATAERFAPRIGMLGRLIGASKLGYNLIALAPGKRAFPFHSHRVNEEMFFVVAGEGEIRIGATRHALRAGDVVACPSGGPGTAHQIINTSQAELRYIAVSTQQSPDVCEYPDSAKYSVIVDGEGGFKAVARLAESVDYWDGE
jgi:uncharacterized cupin superfamily protein